MVNENWNEWIVEPEKIFGNIFLKPLDIYLKAF